MTPALAAALERSRPALTDHDFRAMLAALARRAAPVPYTVRADGTAAPTLPGRDEPTPGARPLTRS